MSKINHSDGKHSPWTLKRVLAWILIIALVAMYIVTFILALTASPSANTAFKASLLCTIFLPLFAWVLIWFTGFITHKKNFASMNILNSNPEARKEMEDALEKSDQGNSD